MKSSKAKSLQFAVLPSGPSAVGCCRLKSSRHIAFIPLLIFMFTSGAVIFDADNKGTFIDESRGLAFSPSREEWTMIYKKPGEKFSHENITYTVGSRVLANEASEYSGLFGRILEIRTDDDRETENDTPDIYCKFDPPCLSAARRALEQTFLNSMVRQSVWRI